MTNLDWLAAIVGAHLGHSVALCAVLACSLLFARKMSGGGRYALCGFALLGAVILPAIALAPGGSITSRILVELDAPIRFSEKAPLEAPAAAKLEALPIPTAAAASGGKPNRAVREETSINRAAPASMPTVSVIEGFSGEGAQARVAVPAPQLNARASETPSAPSMPAWFQQATNAAGAVLARLPDLTLFFFCAWIMGTLVLLAKTACDLRASLRMVRNSRAIELPPALQQRFKGVRIAVSEEAPGPIAAGVINPSILLPVDFDEELERPGMVALLEHERAHVERRDMLVALGQRIALAVLWWSPAMHWISRRMDEEREVACDEIAVERTGDPRAFALTLTHQAESQLWAKTPRLAAGAIGGRSQFGRRIARLVDLARGGKIAPEPGARTPGRLAYTGMALVALAAACLTPGVQAKAQEQEADRHSDADAPDLRVIRTRADQTPPAPPAPPQPRPPTPLEGPTVAPLPPVAPLAPQAPESFEELADVAASFGIELSSLLTEELLEELPDLLEEIFESIEESGIGNEEFAADWRAEMADIRRELRTELGPEIRIHIENELSRARAERARAITEASAEARGERARALAEARREMAQARAEAERELDRAHIEIDRVRAEMRRALAGADADHLSAAERKDIAKAVEKSLREAHEQVRRARENGDLDFDFDFQFDFDEFDAHWDEHEQELEGADEPPARGPNSGNFYLEFDLEELQNLSGPQAAPEGAEDHARAGRSSRPYPQGAYSRPSSRIGQNDCPQKG